MLHCALSTREKINQIFIYVYTIKNHADNGNAIKHKKAPLFYYVTLKSGFFYNVFLFIYLRFQKAISNYFILEHSNVLRNKRRQRKRF